MICTTMSLYTSLEFFLRLPYENDVVLAFILDCLSWHRVPQSLAIGKMNLHRAATAKNARMVRSRVSISLNLSPSEPPPDTRTALCELFNILFCLVSRPRVPQKHPGEAAEARWPRVRILKASEVCVDCKPKVVHRGGKKRLKQKDCRTRENCIYLDGSLQKLQRRLGLNKYYKIKRRLLIKFHLKTLLMCIKDNWISLLAGALVLLFGQRPSRIKSDGQNHRDLSCCLNSCITLTSCRKNQTIPQDEAERQTRVEDL